MMRNVSRHEKRCSAGVALLIWIGTCCWFGLFAVGGVDPHHDGIMLKPAADLASGQLLFRETFSQYGALTVLIQSLAIRWGGEMLLAVRLSAVLFYGFSAVLLVHLSRRLLSGWWAWLPLGLFWGLAPFYLYRPDWVFLPWSSVYALTFQLLTVVLCVEQLLRPRRFGWWGVGAAGMAAFWCRQPAGLALAAAGALVVALHWLRGEKEWGPVRRRIGALTGGALVVSLPFFFCFSLFALWGDWFRQNLGFAARFGAEAGGTGWWRVVKAFLPPDPFFALLPYLMAGMTVWLVLAALRERGSRFRLAWVATAFAGLAALHQYFPVGCPRHWYWGAVLSFPCFALVLQMAWCREGRRRLLCRVTAVLLMLAVVVDVIPRVAGIGRYGRFLASSRTLPDGPLAGMRLEPDQYRYWTEVEAAFARIPEPYRSRQYVNLSADAIYAMFFPERRNLHPMHVNWDNLVYPDYWEQMKKLLGEYKPVVCYFSDAPIPGGRYFARVDYGDGRRFWYILLPLD